MNLRTLGRGRQAGARASALARPATTWSPSRFPTPSCAKGSERCFATHTDNEHRQVTHVGTLSVDLASHEVHVDERPVALGAKEFELLRALMSDPACSPAKG